MITAQPDITIRQLTPAEADALVTLAERDSAQVPAGAALGAFDPDGAMLAAISLETDELVADPFEHTAHVAALLRVRAEQLRGDVSSRQGLRSRLRLRTAAA